MFFKELYGKMNMGCSWARFRATGRRLQVMATFHRIYE